MSDMTTPQKGSNPKDFYRDSPLSGIKAVDLLAAARLSLLCKHPFFGKIAVNMAYVETDKVPTTAVDARGTFYYNPKWVNGFDQKDSLFESAHEVMHIAQRLWSRKPKHVNHGIYNMAADILADVSLMDAGLEQSKISAKMVTPERVAQARIHDTVPKMYKFLLDEAKNQTDCPACKKAFKDLQDLQEGKKKAEEEENKKLNEAPGGEDDDSPEGDPQGGESASPGDDDGDGHGDGCGEGCGHGEGEGCGSSDGDDEPQHTCGNVRMCCAGNSADASKMDPVDQQKWTEVIISAKLHAENKGNMPAGLSDYVNELTKSKVRWQDHIKTRATKIFGQDRYSYRKLSRRGPAMKLRLPGHQPDGKSAVAAVDTSGSMSVREAQQCISECCGIMKACGCEKLWLILHDMRTYYSGWVTEADLTKLEMARGGTSHVEVFQCLDRTHPNQEMNFPATEEVVLAIMFTDLGTDFPNEKPGYDVIWGVPSDGYPGMKADVPFGKKVEVEMSE
jgi:predicted metal-dependent peptidase